ncbi:hypothetical protein QBC36DRAFT_336174, partial [Triangularia setosa]
MLTPPKFPSFERSDGSLSRTTACLALLLCRPPRAYRTAHANTNSETKPPQRIDQKNRHRPSQGMAVVLSRRMQRKKKPVDLSFKRVPCYFQRTDQPTPLAPGMECFVMENPDHSIFRLYYQWLSSVPWLYFHTGAPGRSQEQNKISASSVPASHGSEAGVMSSVLGRPQLAPGLCCHHPPETASWPSSGPLRSEEASDCHGMML